MSRITAVRSMAVRPRVFSKLNCCAGANSLSNTTVSASTAKQVALSSSTFPLPMNDAGSGLSRRCVSRATTSAPAVSTSRSSSSKLSLVSASVRPSSVTATSTIFSRIVRSMSVRPSASEYGDVMCCAAPSPNTVLRVTRHSYRCIAPGP